MAELTPLDEKLGEVLGLAQAAQQATTQVSKLTNDRELKDELRRMKEEAKETEQRTKQVTADLEGKKTAINRKARETKQEATEMMSTYLSGDDVDELDGFEFLIMAEAGELGHWEIVRTMNERVGDARIGELAEFAIPIQERHFSRARETSLALAQEEASG